MLETKSLIHKENGYLTPKNNVENDDEIISINKLENNIGNFVSHDDHVHEDVGVDISVARIDVVNKNDKKRKSASKRKKGRVVEDVEDDINNNLNDIEVSLN
ncbi:unnamed protein product [Vicia faba]|uniref:Uncharacterized protein n=1 Tax=Vicia faba TaxID=3906 RepID=A0AAV1A0V3_VICFA|nr:unnamed protein product [Vicia faba]